MVLCVDSTVCDVSNFVQTLLCSFQTVRNLIVCLCVHVHTYKCGLNQRHYILRNRDWKVSRIRVTMMLNTSGEEMAKWN